MRLKVIIFLFYSHGGMYHYCTSLAESLSKYCKVYFFIPQNVTISFQNKNLTLFKHNLPKIGNISSYINIINILNILWRIRQINPNIIHFPSTNYALWFLLPILKRNFPIVTTIHDPLLHPSEFSIQKSKTKQFIIKNSKSIIVHDKFGKKILSENNPDRIFIVKHISLEQMFKRYQNFPLYSKGYYVLFFGRLSEYKGLDVLAKAANILQNTSAEIKIKIYGKGKLGISEKIFKKCSNVQINNRYINDEDIPQIFIDSRFVVLPYTSATQSGIIPIAYHFGKPVIVTKVGGLPESVLEGKTGFIIQPSNHKTLAKKIEELWDFAEEDYSRMKENCERWIKKNISPLLIAKKTLKVYLKTINYFRY